MNTVQSNDLSNDPSNSRQLQTDYRMSTVDLVPPKKGVFLGIQALRIKRLEKKLVEKYSLQSSISNKDLLYKPCPRFEGVDVSEEHDSTLDSFKKIIQVKERCFGTASPDFVDSLIYTARFCYQRARDYTLLANKSGIKFADECLEKAILLVNLGEIPVSKLLSYSNPSIIEQEIGSSFLELFEEKLPAFAISFEKAHAAQFHHGTARCLLEYDRLISDLNFNPASNDSVSLESSSFQSSKLSPKETSLLSLQAIFCLLYRSPSPRDATLSRMPSSA